MFTPLGTQSHGLVAVCGGGQDERLVKGIPLLGVPNLSMWPVTFLRIVLGGVAQSADHISYVSRVVGVIPRRGLVVILTKHKSSTC